MFALIEVLAESTKVKCFSDEPLAVACITPATVTLPLLIVPILVRFLEASITSLPATSIAPVEFTLK